MSTPASDNPKGKTNQNSLEVKPKQDVSKEEFEWSLSALEGALESVKSITVIQQDQRSTAVPRFTIYHPVNQ